MVKNIKDKRPKLTPVIVVAALAAIVLSACTTVRLEGGDKPIEVNLNIKIDQEVRVKLDREIEDLIAANPDIF
jgi:predicted small secreted protein